MSVTDLQIGDRFEVTPSRLPDRLELPRSLGPEGFAIEMIEDDTGRVLNSAIDPAAGTMIVPELASLFPDRRPFCGLSIVRLAAFD